MKTFRLSTSLFLKAPATRVILAFIAFGYVSTHATPVDANTLAILDDCAHKNTAFLKGKITQSSIKRFQDYYSKNFSKSCTLPLVMISFTQPSAKKRSSGWSLDTTINSNEWSNLLLNRAKSFVSWLQQNYTPKKNLKLFYLLAEPYFCGWNLEQKFQNELSTLLDSCPLLISCNHPDLKWTMKGVLIPDDYILVSNFNKRLSELLSHIVYPSLNDLDKINMIRNHPDLPLTQRDVLVSDDYILVSDFDKKMSELLSCATYQSLDTLDKSGQKGLVPFSQRKSKLFFSGGLSGPKLPFSKENLAKNPRHNILTLLTQYHYLEIKISDFLNWTAHHPLLKLQLPSYSYLAYLQKNFSHLKSDRVDFFEHAKNKYLLSFDGFGAAWSRPQLIMATGSVLFMNAQCKQYFYPLMENNTTHVTLNNDLSNLNELYQHLEANPDIAEKIGQQGKAFAQRFFTEPAIDAYLTAVLTKIESYTDSAQ